MDILTGGGYFLGTRLLRWKQRERAEWSLGLLSRYWMSTGGDTTNLCCGTFAKARHLSAADDDCPDQSVARDASQQPIGCVHRGGAPFPRKGAGSRDGRVTRNNNAARSLRRAEAPGSRGTTGCPPFPFSRSDSPSISAFRDACVRGIRSANVGVDAPRPPPSARYQRALKFWEETGEMPPDLKDPHPDHVDKI